MVLSLHVTYGAPPYAEHSAQSSLGKVVHSPAAKWDTSVLSLPALPLMLRVSIHVGPQASPHLANCGWHIDEAAMTAPVR